MVVVSVQIISRLDFQSKFQMLALFSGRHVGLCKFAQNVWTNIYSLGKRRDPKLGEVSSLPVSYNYENFLTYPLNSFRFIFSLRDSENHL